MRKFWCSCGATVEANVTFEHGAYVAEFFDATDRVPLDNCPSCDEELYPMLCEGTLSETPPARRPLQMIRSAR